MGPGNYSTIQAAIDAASPGDTVFVFDDHAPYYEHLLIAKTLNLQGEAKETTIIDGNGSGDVITFKADSCSIAGFTVQHSGANPMVDANIKLYTTNTVIHDMIVRQSGNFTLGIFFNNSQNSTVFDNTIYQNGNEGVFLKNSSHILIHDNNISHNRHCAVIISYSTQNRVTHNLFNGNMAGVSIWPGSANNTVDNNTISNGSFSGVGVWYHAKDNTIRDNLILNNDIYGILLTTADRTTIIHNDIIGSNPGIQLKTANYSRIYNNNFKKNVQDAFFENSSHTRWQGNYWDQHPFGFPVLIHGTRLVPWNETPVNWLNVDWHPATRPNP